MQSINISHLVQIQENKEIQIRGKNKFCQNYFLKLLNTDDQFLLITNNQSKNNHKFLLLINKQKIHLIINKEKKLQSIKFNFLKQFLTINKRRGLKKDFEKLSKLLKLIASSLNKDAAFAYTNIKIEGEEPTKIKNMINDINIEKETIYLEKNKLKIGLITKGLLQTKKAYFENKTDKKLKHILLEIYKKFQVILAGGFKNCTINGQSKGFNQSNYKLDFNKIWVHFLEKTQFQKNEVVLNYKKKEYQINKEPITMIKIEWFLKRVVEVGKDLMDKRAVLKTVK
tara:strand:+ start:318 stop:1169 length:852 start_codon:yes stop_codon:yes gene_type:complete